MVGSRTAHAHQTQWSRDSVRLYAGLMSPVYATELFQLSNQISYLLSDVLSKDGDESACLRDRVISVNSFTGDPFGAATEMIKATSNFKDLSECVHSASHVLFPITSFDEGGALRVAKRKAWGVEHTPTFRDFRLELVFYCLLAWLKVKA